MAAAIGRAKDQVMDEDAYARSADNFYEETVARVYSEYERRKHAAGALDFDDLITETVKLFQLHPEVLEHYQERFRYILVDEYQDTNRAQYELVNLLAARYRNVCVVGDADQGVYSWRGADHPEHPRLRARLPRRGGVPDGAELPLHAEHPGHRERLDRAQRAPQAEEPVDRGGQRRAGGACTGRRTSTTRRSSSPTRSSGCARAKGSATATWPSSIARTRRAA